MQDASGNPVLTAGIPIVASLTGASLGGNPTATTDGTGAASYSDLAIIGTPGSHTLTFSSPELTPTSVPVTLPAVSSIQVGEAAPVSAVVAGQITGTPIWILKDAAGQTVADVPVTVTASAGGSVLADAASNGIGGVQVNSWTLAPTAGDQSLQITVTGTNLSNTVQVQATPAPAFALEKISGDAQTDTTANGELDSLLVVRLVDQYGNGISGVVIQWRTCDGTGDYDAVTTSDGSSSAAIDTPEVGTFCTRASTSGLPQNFSVDFTYTVTAAGSAPTEVGASQSGGRTAPTAPRAPLSPPSTR